MSVSRSRSNLLRKSSVATTLVDALLAFKRGRPKSGLLLLGAAALSSRFPGAGTLVSLALRAYRRGR
jgi:hypothetical protein